MLARVKSFVRNLSVVHLSTSGVFTVHRVEVKQKQIPYERLTFSDFEPKYATVLLPFYVLASFVTEHLPYHSSFTSYLKIIKSFIFYIHTVTLS